MGFHAHPAMFKGANNLTLDTKGRMVMPTRYRDQLQELCAGKLVVTVDRDRCLLIYPGPAWQEVEAKLMSLPTFNPLSRQLQRLMVGYATELELDGHGRMLLPPNLRTFAHLTRDAVLLGQGKKFELWDEARLNGQIDALLTGDESAGGLSAELEKLSL